MAIPAALVAKTAVRRSPDRTVEEVARIASGVTATGGTPQGPGTPGPPWDSSKTTVSMAPS